MFFKRNTDDPLDSVPTRRPGGAVVCPGSVLRQNTSFFWHILHNLIQCNANGESVAFFLKAEFCVTLVWSLLTYVVLYAVRG